MALAPSAYAEEDMCQGVYERSQELMKPKDAVSTLLPAREMLRTCMRSGCADWIVADCSKWLADVATRIPSVVFSAASASGDDVTDVRVTTDGVGIVERLDGRAVEMEPGERVFVFIAGDGTTAERSVLVREGEKSQRVAVIFEGPAGAPPSAPPVPERAPLAPPPPSKLRYGGYAAAGLGALGVGVGAVFGLRAMGKKDGARCDGAGACDDGDALGEARRSATTATVAFAAGGALLAAGVALVLLAPSTSSPREAHLRPMVGAAGGGLELGGRW